MSKLSLIFPKLAYRLVPEDKGNSFLRGIKNELVYDTGDVVLGNEIQQTYRKDNALYWENPQEKGCVWLYYNGLAGHGKVRRGGLEQTVSVQADDVEYDICYRNGNLIKYTIAMGTRKHPKTGGFIIYGCLYMNRGGEKIKIIESYQCDETGVMKPGEADNGFFKTSFRDRCLQLEIDCSSLWFDASFVHDIFGKDFNLWSATLKLSPDGSCIEEGIVIEQGTSDEGVTKAGGKFTVIKTKSCFKTTLPEKPRCVLKKDTVCLADSMLAMGSAPMSITQLYTLPAPNMKAANEEAVHVLYYLSVYYVAEKEYTLGGNTYKWNEWFGIPKETAREKIIAVNKRILSLVDGEKAVDSVKKFLEKYAEAMLSYSYINSNDKNILRAFSTIQDKLKKEAPYCSMQELCAYYLEGDDEDTLSSDPGYIYAMEEINKYTYAYLTPGLEAYIEDTIGKWGEKLYEQCDTNIQQLRITTLTSSEGSTEVSHKCMMLSVLDTELHTITNSEIEDDQAVAMTYAAAIYAKLFNLQLAEMANKLGIEYICPEDMDPEEARKYRHEIMTQVFGCLWDELHQENSDYFAKDVMDQLKEITEASAGVAKETYIQHCLDITEYSLELLSSGTSVVSLLPKLNEFAQQHNKCALAAPIVSIVTYAMSMAALSTVFMDWRAASSAEKAEAVLICVQGVANISISVAKIADIRTLLNNNATAQQKIHAATRLRYGGTDLDVLRSMGDANNCPIDELMDNVGKRYGAKVKEPDQATAKTKFTTKFFKVAEIAVRILNIIVMGFMTVVSALQINKDVRENGYTTSACLSIVSTSLMCISFICEGVQLTLDLIGVSCSFVPVVGAVAAFVGLVFSVVASAVQVQKNPVEEFAKKYLAPFLNALPVPSKEWVEERKKVSMARLEFALV